MERIQFIKLTDRSSRQPVLIDVDDIVAVWAAIDPGDEETGQMVTGSNVFTYTGHGIGEPPRIPVEESVDQVTRALNNAGCHVGWPDGGVM